MYHHNIFEISFYYFISLYANHLCTQIHWHQYVKVFRSLGEEKRFGTEQNFLQSKNLLDTLEINF